MNSVIQKGRISLLIFCKLQAPDEYEGLYRKLAAQTPDIILAIGPEIGLRSALAATRTLPIMMIAIDYDPLARGYVTSLARPSGNVTGVVFQQIELAAKQISLSRITFRIGRPRPCSGMSCLQTNGKQRGKLPPRSACSFLALSCTTPYDYEAAFGKVPLDHRGMLMTPNVAVVFSRSRASCRLRA